MRLVLRRMASYKAGIAQLVERDLAKVEVTSSSLVARSKSYANNGGLAEWPCSGLQIRPPRFDSGTRLHLSYLVDAVGCNTKLKSVCPGGEIGRHKGFKIPRSKGRAGSESGPGHHFNCTCRDKQKLKYQSRLLSAQCLSGHSSVGRARPCQGRGHEFEPRCPLQIKKKQPEGCFFAFQNV